ncbi:hypothetical protein EDD76_103314 [Kineothrix alysoides]|uniref:PRD domain-containing protein n=1 Tax=Kineothrix alysoides TaxID=1469948 RepID=A0A4R1R3T7_9FIRM|nr:hypothetical protein [Kineothrix alysoides]TCL60121.1 hypothetical protein EDD76_103314 [Kineothrix alysoides]
MDIMERINIMKDYDLIDQIIYNDLAAIIDVFKESGILLNEENAGIMITHIASAFIRNKTKEKIESLDREIIKDMQNDPMFDEACRIFCMIKSRIQNHFNEIEREFALVHICTVLNNM